MKKKIHVKGMKCQHCVASTRKALEELGLGKVEIDLASGEVSYEGEASGEDIGKAIVARGFEVIEGPSTAPG